MSHYTILIVDDNPEDRELYRRLLLKDKVAYTVLEASTGRTGLALWQQHRPDLILLDYRLPDLDGLNFLEQLQNGDQQSLPVVMLTGLGNEAIAVKAIKAGAQDYLVKGQITREGLHLAVHSAIETLELHSQLQQRIERERVISKITQQIHRSLDLEEILQTTVAEVRQFLQADRVVVLQLDDDGSGRVTNESVDARWASLLSTPFDDPCLNASYIQRFQQGLVTVKADIDHGSINPCYVELLAKLQVRANLVVPILQDGQLWGMLIVHHCAAPRQWQPLEIDLLKDLAAHLGIALQQSELYRQAQNELAERKQVEASLRKSEEFKQRVLDSSTDCIKILDLEGRLLDMNSSGLRLLEIEDFRPYQNVEWVNFWQNPARQQAEAALSMAKVGEVSTFEGYCPTAKGRPKWWEVIVCPVLDHEGQVERILSISRDVTERLRLEQERDQLLAQEHAARLDAERANQIKDEFLAVLSHELRSPLNPILGWTKLMQSRSFNTERTAEALATIERNAKLQIQLIDDLLDTAKILRGKLSLNLAPVDLAYVIAAAIETVSTAAAAKSIQIHSVLPPVGQVFADGVRLQQVVWNLLSNAIKFTPNQGQVEVHLEQVNLLNPEPSYAQITVSDTGKGINAEFLPHLFQPFWQEDASINRRYGGLGLGLAIVHHLVEAQGGTIWAESKGEGQGSSFTVRLPLLPVVAASNPPPELSEPDLSGIRVLVIDDEFDARELLATLLTQYKAEVMTVASAAALFAELTSFRPDLLISDVGMPDIDGYRLIQQVRQLPAEQGGQIPAIAVTAYAREEDQQRALAAGFQQHLSKPIDPSLLAQTITRLLST